MQDDAGISSTVPVCDSDLSPGICNVAFCTTIVKVRAFSTKIWSAATGRRFFCLIGLPARQSRVQRLGKTPRSSLRDGDKSPAQSGENLPHSIAAVLGSLLLLFCQPSTAAPGFSATLDRNVVPVGESVTLNLVFEGISPAGPPQLPALPNLSFGGVSQSSAFSFANGQQTSTLTYSYTLAATQPGDVVIPSMQVQAGGKALVSQPLQLKIVPAANAAQAQAAALTNLAFLRLVVPKTEVYVGEPLPVEMHLYWQNANDIRMPQLRAEGFSLGQMPKPNQTRTQVGNAIYNLVVFKLTATAARSGTLTLGPAEESLTVLIPAPNQRRSRDPFESFFDLGPRYQQRPTTLTSEPVTLRVLPLPTQNIPEGFNGAIGSYRLAVSAGPTNLAVGDPITVRIQISGNGPLDSITLPPQSDWRDFNSYPATSRLETTDDLGLSGAKSFEQVLVPQNHELKVLPPVHFSFFDPNTRSYRTLTGPAIPLNVRASATAAVPPPSLTNANSGATPPPVDDIVHIRPRIELSATVAPLLVFRPWFLMLQGLPATIWLSLLIWRKRNESLANNPRLRRQREVAQRVRDGLKDLRAQAARQQAQEFFATLFRVLQEQLGERLDLPASAITEAVIDDKLRGRKLADDSLKSLHELFQTCNLARYAPIQSSQELAALIPKLEAVLRDLQALKA